MTIQKRILLLLLVSLPIGLFSKNVLLNLSTGPMVISLSENPTIHFNDSTIDVVSDIERISFYKGEIHSIKVIEEEPSTIIIERNKINLSVKNGEVTIKGIEPGSKVAVSSIDGKSFVITCGESGVVSFLAEKFCIVSIDQTIVFKLHIK